MGHNNLRADPGLQSASDVVWTIFTSIIFLPCIVTVFPRVSLGPPAVQHMKLESTGDSGPLAGNVGVFMLVLRSFTILCLIV